MKFSNTCKEAEDFIHCTFSLPGTCSGGSPHGFPRLIDLVYLVHSVNSLTDFNFLFTDGFLKP